MPNSIDHCASCHSPVYVEEGVPGGCGCVERELRILLAQRRSQATGFSRVASRPPLPELSPEMLLSGAGQRELRDAQIVQGLSFREYAQGRTPIRGRTVDAVIIDDAAGFDDSSGAHVSLEQLWDDAYGSGESTRATPMPGAHVSLEQLWLEGSGIPYDPEAFIATSPASESIQFDEPPDSDGPHPSTGPRVGGERFRVGRDPTPRMPPVARGVQPGPQGGPMREVGRTGRFAILAEAGQREAIRAAEDERIFEALDAIAAAERVTTTPPLPPQEANRRQFAKTLQERQKLPTVYDRLQHGFLDDED